MGHDLWPGMRCGCPDLVAVLTPCGPLKVLIESSRRQNVEIPALLYSGTQAPYMTPRKDARALGPIVLLCASSTYRQPCLYSCMWAGTCTVNMLYFMADAEPPLRLRVPVGDDTDASSTTSDSGVQLITAPAPPAPARSAPSRSGQGATGAATEAGRPSAASSSAPANDEEEERSGLKLGLGDFVFYSVLVARACTLLPVPLSH
jgi:presenilin 1